MPTLTREQDKAILQYLLAETLQASSESHPIQRAFVAMGIYNLGDFIAITNTNVFSNTFYDDIQGEEGEITKRQLPTALAQRCTHLRNFVACVIDENYDIPTLDEWESYVDYSKFLQYCANPRVPN